MSDDNGFDAALIDRVRTAMRTEVGDVQAPAALLADVRRRHTRRVTARRIAVFASPVLAAAIAAVGVVTISNGKTTSISEPVNAAYVKEQTSKALDNEEHDVVYEQATETNGGKYSAPGQRALYERWYSADRTAFRVRVSVDGAVVWEQSSGPGGGASVDYQDRTWRPTSPTPRDGQALAEEVLTPERIRQDLADDSLKVTGQGGLVNGRPTLLLHREPTGKAEVPIDLWVDEASYLPVQFRYQQDDSVPFGITWLAPTNENLALLDVSVPEGFQKRP